MGRKKSDKICSIIGCGKKHSSKGFCSTHYARLTRHGNAESRTRFDKNDIIINEDISQIKTFDKDGNINYIFEIDSQDVPIIKDIKWYSYKGYAHNDKHGFMHNLFLQPEKGYEVDHIDGNPRNNKRNNLRICTHHQNCMNRGFSKNNTSGFKGVSWDKRKGKYVSYINPNKKSIFLGAFNNTRSAALAYNCAAIKYCGEFARLNNVF